MEGGLRCARSILLACPPSANQADRSIAEVSKRGQQGKDIPRFKRPDYGDGTSFTRRPTLTIQLEQKKGQIKF